MDVADRWTAALVDEGFQGEKVLLDALVKLLMDNQFTGISNLKYADNPREWEGASEVDADGLAFLNQIRKRRRSSARSR